LRCSIILNHRYSVGRRDAIATGYPGSMSVAYDHYPELHDLIERLRPENADQARRALLRLVEDPAAPPTGRLARLPQFDGPANLSERLDDYLFDRPTGAIAIRRTISRLTLTQSLRRYQV
jgi:hypothetical protein